ncbi:glycoside hydrolase superfamily [Crepidotus variabilis]|uniref:Glycoside hydrolase superfamily n=1 Tax=Crepidotus variabilis TaxID=179855 RepID=A0A9P6EPF9_9AGAR|nr:glycoside hydrolase superfamily [Crepidotus variabilis]
MPVANTLRRGRFLAATILLLQTTNLVNALDMHHRRQHLDISMHKRGSELLERAAVGEKVSFGYFSGLNTSGTDFSITDIDTDSLTHVLYSFANVNSTTGILSLSNAFVDEQNQFNSSSNITASEDNLYGNLGELYQLKLQNRHLKVLLSVGGLNQSDCFDFATNSTARHTFVANATQFIRDYALDGIDLNYEFPSTDEEGQGFADLVTSLRYAFDELQSTKGEETPYLLSAAVSAGTNNSAHYKIHQMNAALDYWNFMAFNYSGNWSAVSDNHANLFGGQESGVSTDGGINWFISNGASPHKITLGIPLFGRTFENTTGLGQPFNTTLSSNSTVSLYKDLPYEGAVVFENLTDVSSFSFDKSKGLLISFDTPNITLLKAQYILNKGLAGSMFLDLSMDKTGNDSLVKIVTERFNKMDSAENHIDFPESKFGNVRDYMGMDCGSDSDTTDPSGSSNSTGSSVINAPSGSVAGASLVPPSFSLSRFSTIFVSSTRPPSSSQTRSSFLDSASGASSTISGSANSSVSSLPSSSGKTSSSKDLSAVPTSTSTSHSHSA